MSTYCPLSISGVSESSLGQVLAGAFESWKKAQEIRGLDAGEPLVIPPELADE